MGSDQTEIIFKTAPLAKDYERVHFVHHYVKNDKVTRDILLPIAGQIVDKVCEDTGFLAFAVDIQVHQYAFTTDVDFILDCPTQSPIAPVIILAILKAIAIILALIAVLGILILIFVTIWTEKYQLYICEQHEPDAKGEYPMFQGWLNYVAHLKAEHPTKYQAVQENQASNWWEGLANKAVLIAIILGGALILGRGTTTVVVQREEKKEEKT